MTLPGVTVTPVSSGTASSPPTDTGKWFVVGMTEQGPHDRSVTVKNLNQYIRYFGARVSHGYLYDALETFFAEGGSEAEVGRVIGPTPVKATGNLSDGSGTTLTAKAKGYGIYGNEIDVITTVPGAGTFQFAVTYLGATVETSPVLNNIAEAVAWATNTSQYVDMTAVGSADPVAATTALASGTDDYSNATETTWANAMALFTKDKGPGQVSAPGRVTATTQTALLAHAAANNRVAVLDTADSVTVATHTSQAATLRALSTARYGALFGPWAVIPGITPGTTRTVPYSAVQAGLIARTDSAGNNANVAAAGSYQLNGIARYATALSQVAWSDANRETLHDAGVNVALVKYGAVETYGYRTLVNPLVDDTWIDFGNARVAMQISAESYAVGETFVLRQIDGQGIVASEFAAALTGEILLPLYEAGALYGDTFQDAASVDTGNQVNTEETIADGELHALISVRLSPHAERVIIEITKEAI